MSNEYLVFERNKGPSRMIKINFSIVTNESTFSPKIIKYGGTVARGGGGRWKDWRNEMTANGESLDKVQIRRGIFQGDTCCHISCP